MLQHSGSRTVSLLKKGDPILVIRIIQISFALFLAACEVAQESAETETSPSVQEGPDIEAAENTNSVLVVDLPAIAGQPPEVVASQLGDVTSEEMTANAAGVPYPKKYYRSGQIDVVYVDGKADWILIEDDDFVFSPSILNKLGLDRTPPSLSNQFTIRWNNVPGFKEISVFPDTSGGVHYVYVNVTTSP